MRQVPRSNTHKMSNYHTFRFRVSDPAKSHDIACAVLGLSGGIVKAMKLKPVATGSKGTTWDLSVDCFVASMVAPGYTGPALATDEDLVQAMRDCVAPGVALVHIPYM